MLQEDKKCRISPNKYLLDMREGIVGLTEMKEAPSRRVNLIGEIRYVHKSFYTSTK